MMRGWIYTIIVAFFVNSHGAWAEAVPSAVCESLFQTPSQLHFDGRDIRMNSNEEFGEYSAHLTNILEAGLEHLKSGGLEKNFYTYFKPSAFNMTGKHKYVNKLRSMKAAKIQLVEKLIELHKEKVSTNQVDQSWALRLSHALIKAVGFSGVRPLDISTMRRYPHQWSEIPSVFRETYSAHEGLLKSLEESGGLAFRKDLHPFLGDLTEQDVVTGLLNNVQYLVINFDVYYADGKMLSPVAFFQRGIELNKLNQLSSERLAQVRDSLSAHFHSFAQSEPAMANWVITFMYWYMWDETEAFNEGRLDDSIAEAFIENYIQTNGTGMMLMEAQLIMNAYESLIK
jgi:hypothetical protein